MYLCSSTAGYAAPKMSNNRADALILAQSWYNLWANVKYNITLNDFFINMIISEIEQSYTLFEWYAVDKIGHIAYFDSEAKPLPFSVASSSEDLECLTSYFENLKPISNFIITDFFFNQTKKNLEQVCNYRKTYSQSETIELINNVGVIPIVKGGVFIYSDKDIGSPQRIHAKSIVPTNPLHISELPITIQNILNKTKFNDRFESSDEVNIDTIP